MHKESKHRRKADRRKLEFTPITFETEISKGCNYLITLPNGETVWLMYSEEGSTLSVSMYSSNDKTYIEVLNKQRGCSADLDNMR